MYSCYLQEITLWRKGERARKAYPQGVQAGAQYVHQLPAAMARHVAGDTPSQNIRTAPTPSEPNTPVVDGPVTVQGQIQPGQQQPHFHSVPIPGPHTIPSQVAGQQQQERFTAEQPKPVPESEEVTKPVSATAEPVSEAPKVTEVEPEAPTPEPVIESAPSKTKPEPIPVEPVAVPEPVSEPVSVPEPAKEPEIEAVTEKLSEATVNPVQEEKVKVVEEEKKSDPEPVKATPEPVKTGSSTNGSGEESPEKFRESPPPMSMPDEPDDDLDLVQGSEDEEEEDLSDITEEKKREPVPS